MVAPEGRQESRGLRPWLTTAAPPGLISNHPYTRQTLIPLLFPSYTDSMTVFLLDLRRTARRGRPAALRAVYALALLAALGGLFVRSFPAALAFDPQLLSRET